MSRIYLQILIALLLCGCQTQSNYSMTGVEPADLFIYGDDIITMEAEPETVNTVVVKNGLIIAVGDRKNLSQYIGDTTRVIELAERSLLPGFIDAHGHLSFVARLMDSVNLSSPPVGKVTSIDDLIISLRSRLSSIESDSDEWLSGYGYDDSLLKEKRHPTRDDLDKVSKDIPIVLLHVSAHLAVANSKALEISGITDESVDPPGGVIRRYAGSNTPNGVLEESAIAGVAFGSAFKSTPTQFADQINRAIDYHASFGVTTIQDGAANLQDIEMMRELGESSPYRVDIAAYLHASNLDDALFSSVDYEPQYSNGFRVAGFKFVLDGSPQGRTAWVTEPYAQGPPNVDATYVAYPSNNIALYKNRAIKLLSEGIPFLTHANGDAAIDTMLDTLEEAGQSAYQRDHRSVIIHAQLMRADQIPRVRSDEESGSYR